MPEADTKTRRPGADELLTIAAAVLGITRPHVFDHIAAGRLEMLRWPPRGERKR